MTSVPGRLYGAVANRLGAERQRSAELDEQREKMRKLAIKYETKLDLIRGEWAEEREALKVENKRLRKENSRLRKRLAALGAPEIRSTATEGEKT